MSKSNDNKKKENIFEILDNIILQLNQTKKLFIIMVLSILIIPPIALLVAVSVFDDPFKPHEEILQIRQEFRQVSSEYNKLFAGLDQLSPEDREKRVMEIVNSPEFVEISEKLNQLSQDERVMDGKGYGKPLHIKTSQLIIFVISAVWLGIGIRQWIVLSKWNKKYQRYKKAQDDINKELADDDDQNNS